tara:strand:- start:1206 stop:1796 length:591 start_codon:yes stop_codon:yes gene_type:complete
MVEPNIIDYYNEMPHSINVIDKMNEELTELQKKYDKLKDPNPKILFKSIQEYYEKHAEMYKNIRNICNSYFDDHYEGMDLYGVKIVHTRLFIPIENELYKITNDRHFSYSESGEILQPIFQIFKGIESPYWTKIYNSLTKDELKEIVLHNIKYYIEKHSRYKYAKFKCYQCGKIDDYVNDENICFDCSDPETDSDS